MTPLRKTALYIHRLQPADQAWLLSQLNEDERALVQGALSELQSMGLSSEDAATLFDELSANASAHEATTQDPRNSVPSLAGLDGVDPSNVVRMFRDEHPAVAAAVLGAEMTVYNQFVLARLPARYRELALDSTQGSKYSWKVRDIAVARASAIAKGLAEARASRDNFYWVRALFG